MVKKLTFIFNKLMRALCNVEKPLTLKEVFASFPQILKRKEFLRGSLE